MPCTFNGPQALPTPPKGQLGRDLLLVGSPAASTEKALAAQLIRHFPPPLAMPAGFVGPAATNPPGFWGDLYAARYRYYSLTQGYGPFAELATQWLLNQLPPTYNQCRELFVYCQSRSRALNAAYTFKHYAHQGVNASVLHPRDIYPLIESSEKGSLSYSLGSTLAAVTASHCFEGRGFGHLERIYHLRLVASSNKCANVLAVVTAGKKEPDYIGLTLLALTSTVDPLESLDRPNGDTGAGRLAPRPAKAAPFAYHVIESKGCADVKYESVLKGVEQVAAVVSVGGLAPASRNVSVTMHWNLNASSCPIVTNMISLPSESTSAGKGGRLLYLDGMYLAAMACFFAGWKNASPSNAVTKHTAYVEYATDEVVFAIAAEADRVLSEVLELLMLQRWSRPDLKELLEDLGQRILNLDFSDADLPAGDRNWVSIEGHWLWVGSGAQPQASSE